MACRHKVIFQMSNCWFKFRRTVISNYNILLTIIKLYCFFLWRSWILRPQAGCCTTQFFPLCYPGLYIHSPVMPLCLVAVWHWAISTRSEGINKVCMVWFAENLHPAARSLFLFFCPGLVLEIQQIPIFLLFFLSSFVIATVLDYLETSNTKRFLNETLCIYFTT